MSIRQFEREAGDVMTSKDSSLRDIAELIFEVWSDDSSLLGCAIKLRGRHRMTRAGRRVHARLALFLRSNNRFMGPDFIPSVSRFLDHPLNPLGDIVLCECGCERRRRLRHARVIRAVGQRRLAWPFADHRVLAKARANRTYLAGCRSES